MRLRSELNSYWPYRLVLLLVLGLLGLGLRMMLRPAVELSPIAEAATDDREAWKQRAAEFISRVHGVWVAPERVLFPPLYEAPAWYESKQFVPVVFTAVPDRPPIEMPIHSTRPDLFYVELAMTPNGVPVDSRRFTNVTRTPAAAEVLLGRSESTVAVSSRVLGQVQMVQLIDFGGDRTEPVVREGTSPWLADLMIGLDNLHNTGRWEGVHWQDYLVTVPVDRIEAQQRNGSLALALYLRDEHRGDAVLSLLDGQLQTGHDYLQARTPRRHLVGDPLSWAANWVRNLEWVGAERMALVEQLVFMATDHVKQWLYDWFGYTGAPPIEEGARPVGTTGTPVIVRRSAEDTDAEWPPPPVEQPYRFDEDLEGEGEWVVAAPEWVRELPEAPPAFLQTFLRTNRERPYAWVLIIAMDLRQLEFSYQQGTDHPRPTTGHQGTGEIPRDRETMDRLVAAFNGGFKTTHGAFGSMVDGTVFLEPLPHRATLAWTNDSDALLFGTWGPTTDIPESVVSLRQNLQPLYADGTTNPTRRWRWFADNDMDPVTVRSAVCFRGEHTLMYFWSLESSFRDVARAMRQADCQYGMHLDMNPFHTGWEFYRINDFATEDWRSIRAAEDMQFHHQRYLESDNKDFFYLLLRRTFPTVLPPLAGAEWTGQGLPTTRDGFLPLAATARTDGQAVRLVAVDRSLLSTTFALGAGEPEPPTTPYHEQPPLEVVDPTIVVSFDAADAESPRGLTVDDWNYFPTVGSHVWLTRYADDVELVETYEPSSSTRVELQSLEALATYSGVCTTMAHLPEPPSFVFSWGNVRDTARRLDELGVDAVGVLGCGRHVARVEAVRPVEGGWRAVDLFTGDERHIVDLQGQRSRLIFQAQQRGPRVQRLFMDEAGTIVPEAPWEDYEQRRWQEDEL